MKALKGVALAFLLAALPVAGFAQGKNEKELNPWIDCGIGAMIFDETGWAAAISNVIWDLGTTAVTSNVSSQNTCNSKKAQTALYIGTTYANLTEETAKGDGKHLRAMLGIAGCDSASHGAIIASVRADFSQSLRDPGYVSKTSAAKAEEFYNILQRSVSGEHQNQCRA